MALYFISLRDESASHIIARSYAVALFRILKPHFSPAAAWYLPIVLCAVFPRCAEKPHTIEMERTALPKAEHANCVSPNSVITERLSDGFQCISMARSLLQCEAV